MLLHFVVFLPISKAIYCRLRQIILRALAKAQNPAIMENEHLLILPYFLFFVILFVTGNELYERAAALRS
jgi:hypothetical protein